ncbi:hydrolase [Rhizocola hellebori]|uniref:Hydrolase n=1 Tax=Rhizocola hellebori TaxID=1392758 RepID=A0A8J3QJI5_9ACTN|nr:HIT family protein [Rhizocola hellebori]GIH10807.1 hydrolase [Rhizocola hellebori]
MNDCVFCGIVRGEEPALRVYEDRLTLAFMDTLPATRGHTLVVPKRHRQDLLDATPEEVTAVILAAQRIAIAARESLGADGSNIVQATGAAAHQTVFHLHFHVVPRFSGDSIVIFPRPGLPEEIAAAADHLRSSLSVRL